MTTTEAHAHAARIMDRMRRAYRDRTALPEKDDNCDDLVAAGVMNARELTQRQLQRLYRYIVGEFAE